VLDYAKKELFALRKLEERKGEKGKEYNKMEEKCGKCA